MYIIYASVQCSERKFAELFAYMLFPFPTSDFSTPLLCIGVMSKKGTDMVFSTYQCLAFSIRSIPDEHLVL